MSPRLTSYNRKMQFRQLIKDVFRIVSGTVYRWGDMEAIYLMLPCFKIANIVLPFFLLIVTYPFTQKLWLLESGLCMQCMDFELRMMNMLLLAVWCAEYSCFTK